MKNRDSPRRHEGREGPDVEPGFEPAPTFYLLEAGEDHESLRGNSELSDEIVTIT
jgi:hypothetical protein